MVDYSKSLIWMKSPQIIFLVPPYEIVYPELESESVSAHSLSSYIRRKKRNLLEKEDKGDDLRFGIAAFQQNFKLNVSLNKRLLAPHFRVEVVKHNATIDKKDIKPCHYVGSVKGHERSTAAISTCNGLVRIHR